MCGIILISRHDGKPVQKMVMKRYRKQKARGEDGFGYVAVDKNGIVIDYVRAADEKDIEKAIESEKAPTILFHHRMPTSTANIAEAAHPIFVSNERLEHDYYVVHNGVITNDKKLKTKHEALGYKYTTTIKTVFETNNNRYNGSTVWNDSEAIAIELAELIEGKKKEIEAEGSVAIVAFQVRKSDKKLIAIYYGRGTNPLMVQNRDNDFYFGLSSEGGGLDAAFHKLYRYDFATKAITAEDKRLNAIGTVSIYREYGYNNATGYAYNDDKEWTKTKNGVYVPAKDFTEDDFTTDYDERYLELGEEIVSLRAQINTAQNSGNAEKEATLTVELDSAIDEQMEIEQEWYEKLLTEEKNAKTK